MVKYLSNRDKESMLQHTQQMQDKLHLGKIMQNLKFGKLKLSFGSISDFIEDNLRIIEALNTRRITTKGLTTDFFELDRMTSGLQKSDLVVIYGGASTGKTALKHNNTLFSSKNNKIRRLFFH